MNKLTLDNLIDNVITQTKEISAIQGIIPKNLSRGYIIWECVYNQYKQNIKYLNYLKSIK